MCSKNLEQTTSELGACFGSGGNSGFEKIKTKKTVHSEFNNNFFFKTLNHSILSFNAGKKLLYEEKF